MWGKADPWLASTNGNKHIVHNGTMAATHAEMSDDTGNETLEAIGFQSEGLLLERPDKMLGLRGSAVPKEPLGPGLEMLAKGPEARLDS